MPVTVLSAYMEVNWWKTEFCEMLKTNSFIQMKQKLFIQALLRAIF